MLFGHQNDDTNQPAQDTSGINPLAVDPDTGVSLPVAPEELAQESTAPAAESHESSAPDPATTTAPTSDDSAGATDDTTVPTTASDDLLQPSGEDDLLTLKQQALQQLSPLVGHLDQTAEEKFRTTMMLIQSSDNQALIKEAYEAAQAIQDDKVRARALLDIVNEINYFTQTAQA